MRIGIDYTAAVRQGAGIGRYTRELVRALAKLDRSHHYVLFAAAGGQRLVDVGWPLNFQTRSVPLSDRALAILWHRLQLPLWVELLTGPVDIFHSPDFVLPPVRRAKALLTVHDLSFIRYPQCADANLQAYLNRVVPRSVHRADLVLADSRNTKGDLVELLGVEPDRIEVLYPGVKNRFHPIEDQAFLEEVRRRYNLPLRFILGLGTLQPRKNFTRLIEAYSLLVTHYSSLQLVIAGGKGWLYEEIFATVEHLGLEEKVVFLGFVADEDLPALYNLAELFVFPSLYEGFGIPPLEAMACGTPVITSDASSLPEVVGDAGLMVEATDIEALAEAMKRVLGDNALRERMIAKGVEQAKKFTWEKAAAKLLSLYEAMARGQGLGILSSERDMLVPKFCPHCAGRLAPKMIDEKERLVCQECGFIFYVNPKVAVGALIEDEGRIVLVRRGVEPRAGSWALPSGFTEYGEAIEETAIRECREETGLEVALNDLLGVHSVNSDFHGHFVLILYSAHVVGGELIAGDDASEVGLFAPAELPTDIAFQAHRQALLDWREAIQQSGGSAG